MKISFPNINFNGIKRTNITTSKIVDFNRGTSKTNCVFSKVLQERGKIIQELKSCGIEDIEINGMIENYYKNSEYERLTCGEYDDTFGEFFTVHNADLGRNLTPAEAVVYQAYDMDDYYMQYFGLMPEGSSSTPFAAEKYDIGNGDFSPLELAKYISKGYDLTLSGMITKGTISEDEAKEIVPYYNVCPDNYDNTLDVKLSEYTADKLNKNIDLLNNLTSCEEDEQGNLKSGLIRPLTEKEAASIIVLDSRTDIDSLNNYIRHNNEFAFGVCDMEINGLWDKTPETYRKELDEIRKLNLIKKQKLSTMKIETLQDKIKYVMEKYNEHDNPCLMSLMELDNKKYKDRIDVRAIIYDSRMKRYDPQLLQKNVQVLNSVSEELLEKMVPSVDGRKGHFSFLSNLLRVKDLDERVAAFERYRSQTPKLFETLNKEYIMDYLTDSTSYSDGKGTKDEFLDTIYEMRTGIKPQKPKMAKIIYINSKK